MATASPRRWGSSQLARLLLAASPQPLLLPPPKKKIIITPATKLGEKVKANKAAALPSPSLPQPLQPAGAQMFFVTRGAGGWQGTRAAARAARPSSCLSRRTAGLGQGSCCEFTGAALSHSREE